MGGLARISEAVYYHVNEIIGHHKQVKMRRDMYDMEDIIVQHFNRNIIRMASGSMREGFHMKESDFDHMLWLRHEHVICDLFQVTLYNIYRETIILMDEQHTRPGFVFLRLLNLNCTCSKCRNEIRNKCNQLNNQIYVSSLKFRHAMLNIYNLDNATVHGPCISGFHCYNELDIGFCYASKHWPPKAFGWIGRCKNKRWPPPAVLRSIIQTGCHFMPIGAKNSPNEFMEWRSSFSQAEHKLVYSMNHVQFLVYGLLKLFLKEVLNKDIPDENKLLCSYFMKTAVFWEIQDNITIPWNINNFLSFFWRCYKRLMTWVYKEYCPNFFIPQNNIFYPKITGIRQQQLYGQMLELYSEGLQCLYRCSSVREIFHTALMYPQLSMSKTNDFSALDYDLSLYTIILRGLFLPTDSLLPKSELIKKLSFFLTKLGSNISQAQRMMVYRYAIHFCHRLAFLLQFNQDHERNKITYRSRKQGLRLMEVTSALGCVTNVLYLAIYLYNDGRYTQALHLLQEVQSKLYLPHVMYMYKNVCPYHYVQAVGGQSMITKMKVAMACNIFIPYYTNFPEIKLELSVLKEEGSLLFVSPFALLHFLTFLCYYHLDNGAQQRQSLNSLHSLVNRNDDTYADELNDDISWIILGICYQLSKHPYQALQCYRKAKRYSPLNDIKPFSRIRAVKQELFLIQLSKS